MCLKLYAISVGSLYFNVNFCVSHLLRIFTITGPGGKRKDMWKTCTLQKEAHLPFCVHSHVYESGYSCMPVSLSCLVTTLWD